MQQVTFAWLVVDVLHEDAAWVGTALMVQTLPSLLFLLVGGAVADHFERRGTLISTHALAVLASAALIGAVMTDRLSFGVLLLYAAAWGTLHAVHLPVRDSLLFDVGQHSLARAVSGNTLVQFVAQASGNLVVGTATWLGAPGVIGLQSGLLLAGIQPTERLPRGRPNRHTARGPALREIREGLALVLRSPRLRPLAMLISFNGLFFLGPYFVLLPLLIRDAYAGGVAELSVLMTMFPLGAVTASAWILIRGAPRRRGRAHMLGQLGGAGCLIAIGLTPPFAALLLLTFAWGMCGGYFLNMGRTLYQESTPPAYRGRALSVYALALLGMAPIGTQMAGQTGALVGPAPACVLAGTAMAVLLAVTAALTPVPAFD